jgi:hypothetical protein
MDTALTVFICSTFADLSDEREAVLDAIRRLQLQHDSMEFFGARSSQPIETCLAEVRRSKIIIVIISHLYGIIEKNSGLSFSEAEYIEGYRLQKPCLVYIRDDNIPILPKYMERDPDKLRLLERWKTVLRERHTVASFRDGQDLALQVAADLGRAIYDLKEANAARKQLRGIGEPDIFIEIGNIIQDAINKGASEETVLSTIRKSISSMLTSEIGQEPKVFLSYAHQDIDIVKQIFYGLKNSGINVWFNKLINPGESVHYETTKNIESASIFIYFMSHNRSSWAQQEMMYALNRQFNFKSNNRVSEEFKTFILPVLLPSVDLDDVPPFLRSVQWIDMRDGDVDRAVANLSNIIKR